MVRVVGLIILQRTARSVANASRGVVGVLGAGRDIV